MNCPHLRPTSASPVLTGTLLLLIRLATAPAAVAAERQAPPNATPIPVVQSAAAAQAAMDQVMQGGLGLVADLTLGQEGQIVRAQTAEALLPGRYRLHALVASMPHDTILGEAVALRLTAGESLNVFDPKRWFPKPDRLAPVQIDIVVAEPGALSVAADWTVGNSKLDRKRYRDEDDARRAYLAQRQNAISQLSLRDGARAGRAVSARDEADLGGALGDLLAEEAPRLEPRVLTAGDLPAHRLMLGGLVVERMSPVSVVAVRTDAAAYAPGVGGRVTAELRNLGAEPASVRLEWTVEDDARPGEILARHDETLTLAAGEAVAHLLTAPLVTAGIARLGRVRVEAGVGEQRTDAARTPFVILPEREAPSDRPKKVFAHYMGCYPAGTGATRSNQLSAGKEMRHDLPDDTSRRGGRFRNFPLLPWDPALTPEESADLEIRRAMRIGIDGFAVDAWAGGDGAKEVLDALIRVAEKKDYPFELTICLDPACGGTLVKTVREVLDRWGESPKLARRDGKPLIFSYSSRGLVMETLYAEIDARIPDIAREAAAYRLRTTELGWHLMGQAFRRAEEQVGQPIFYHYDLIYFFHPMDEKLVRPGMMNDAAGAIARHVPALGSFGFYGFQGKVEEVARAVRAAGAEWGGAGGMHQKENMPLEIFMPKGTDWLRFVWADQRRDEASLVQLITWNDYTENSNIAPAYNTRYTIYDLTGYLIEWWRQGKPPAVERDRVYLTYAKYPKEAKSWPFTIQARRDRALEVLTILTAPATVHLPGRDIRYEAPAGFHVEQFPVVPGPVIAELIRGEAVTLRLESPEPITDRPFREDNALVCFSTEFERHWKADYGDVPPLLYSEYGDLDNDGLPNWFEMYWFTEARGFKPIKPTDLADLLDAPKDHPVTFWADMRTATKVDPAADPDGDGLSNLDEYLRRSDPTIPAPPAMDSAGPKRP